MITPRYFVNYTAFGRDYQAGPYTLAEAEDHLADIKAYAGVSGCWIGSERLERRQLVSDGELA